MKTLRRMLQKVTICLLFLFGGSASAALPDSGWYWNSVESGRGFILEIQNNTVFISGFLFDQVGNQMWVYSGGVMSSDRTYSGPAYRAVGGQPLGGAYRQPTNVPFGLASIVFTSTVTADVNINGFAFTLTRFIFGFDTSNFTNALLGEFAFVMGTPSTPVYFGQRITFTHIEILGGSIYAVGSITGASIANNLALGQFVPSLGKWVILLDSSPNYYQGYVMDLAGFNFAEGEVSTYLKTESPGGSLNAIGTRVRSAQAAAGANAPGTPRSVHRPTIVATDAERGAIAAIEEPGEPSPARLESLRELEKALIEVKANRANRLK